MSSSFDSKSIRAFGRGALALALALAISGCQAPSSTCSGNPQGGSAYQAASGLVVSTSGEENQAMQAGSASGQAAQTASPSEQAGQEMQPASPSEQAPAESAQEQPSAPEPQVYSGDVADFEARRAQIEADIDSDPRTGGSMYEMRAAAIDYTTNLESLMNDLYAYALELPGVDTGALEAAQDEWAASWQARLDALKDEFAGSHSSGYAASVRSHSEYAEYLNRRIDELLDLVYATTGAERGASPAEISALQEEPTEEPTYTVRYRVGDESFAGDYAYIPESPNACRAAYGDDCLTLHGYHWSFDVPGTGISATYLEGEEDRGAIGVGGPLYQLVDGIGPDESVPLVELVSHLVSSEGTFDLTQVDVQGKASAFGNSYIYHSGYGSKDFTNYTGSVVILFAESPVDPQASFYSQGRVLQVSSENGYVSGSSQAGLSPWLQ